VRITRGRVVAILGAIALVALVIPRSPDVVEVAAGDDVQRVFDRAEEGSVIRLGAGIHEGPLRLNRALALEGEPGARIVAPTEVDPALTVAAPDVSISNLTVEGGWTGIDLVRAPRAHLSDLVVTGARLEGIRVYVATALVERVTVSDLVSPHAQGIEVLSAPDVVVRDSTVRGGKVGIVAHLSTVTFESNTVTGTTSAGIMIREMSAGSASDNQVSDSIGAGLYCGDMSRCDFAANRVDGIAGGGLGRSGEGWGLVVTYHSVAASRANDLSGTAGAEWISDDSTMKARSPLDPGTLSDILVPATVALLAAVALILVGTGTARALAPHLVRFSRATIGRPRMDAAMAGALVVGLGVQTFHMIEHSLQVFRVHVDHVPSRGGIVGPSVDAEWIHLTYNSIVFIALLVVAAILHSRERDVRWTFVGGAIVIQGYHVLEHVVKTSQHILTGAKVNPGIIGGNFNLVWFHFTINLAVYVLCVAAAVAWVVAARRGREPAPARAESLPAPA
jgi:Right handed beta helix region